MCFNIGFKLIPIYEKSVKQITVTFPENFIVQQNSQIIARNDLTNDKKEFIFSFLTLVNRFNLGR